MDLLSITIIGFLFCLIFAEYAVYRIKETGNKKTRLKVVQGCAPVLEWRQKR
jgi:hypothetical protein